MIPMQLTDEQSINSALFVCQTGAGMTFHAAKWLFIHERKKHKQNGTGKPDPLISDVCSAMRGGHVEDPKALGSLADELTAGYGLQPGSEHIWLGNRSDLSYFWKKDANGKNISLDRSQLDSITDPDLRAKVQSVLSQAQLEGHLELYGNEYSLTDAGRGAILQPEFVRRRLEGEAKLYGDAVEGLGQLQNDRIDQKLEELGLTDRFADCDRITLNKEKLFVGEGEQAMHFYIPGTHRERQIAIPKQDVIELDESTFAAFLRKDVQYRVNGQPTAEKDAFRLFDSKNKKQAADIRATVSKAEAAAKKEIELNGKKLYVLQNGVAREHTVTRVWTSPDGAHLHLHPANEQAADLLLPEGAIGKLAFPTAAEANAYLEAHPQDVEAYSALLRQQEAVERIPSFTVPQERVTAVGDGYEVQTDAPYERVVFGKDEVQLPGNGKAIITPENGIHTVRTGNVSYEVTGQGARELAEKAKRTTQKAVEAAEKATQKTVEKTAEAVTNAVPTGPAGTAVKATVKAATKSVELVQYAAKLADGTAEMQLPSRAARLVQKLYAVNRRLRKERKANKMTGIEMPGVEIAGIPVKDFPKNRKTMNNKYHVYRTRFVKKTGLPWHHTPEGKLLVAQHPELTGYSRKAARERGVKLTGEVIGFLRVYKGYVPLYRPIESVQEQNK